MISKVDTIIVVKIGGATFGNHDTAVEDIAYLQQKGRQVVVVHGGANLVTRWLTNQGTATSFVNGERVTDKPALDMVTAVLAGLVNKEIVAHINILGGRAVGICGIDGALIQSRIREKEMGFVGEVVKVDLRLIKVLLESGFIPVIGPLALHSFDRPDKAPLSLNVNGDTMAGEIAAALRAERLIFLTDVSGVLDQSGNLLPQLSQEAAEFLIVSGVVSKGMAVKIKACLRALSSISSARIIDGTKPHALLKEIEGAGQGTTVGALK